MKRSSLAGKTALVTGAAKRMGRAISIALAGAGCNIVVHYRGSAEDAQSLMRELAQAGAKSWPLQADFEQPEEYETLIQRAVAAAGSLDILVNNASIFPLEKLDELTFDSLVTNVQVNAWVPFVLMRDFARLAGKGSIINMIDSRIADRDWTHTGYIFSKHVLAAMTDMAALAYAPEIRVNGVCPGLILPPPGKDESYIDKLVHTMPLKRHGEAEDIADAVLYLAQAEYVTGELIFVDGGRHLKEYSDG